MFPVVRYGKIYLKAAKSCLEKGADYPKKEIERLQRILDKVRIAFEIEVNLSFGGLTIINLQLINRMVP